MEGWSLESKDEDDSSLFNIAPGRKSRSSGEMRHHIDVRNQLGMSTGSSEKQPIDINKFKSSIDIDYWHPKNTLWKKFIIKKPRQNKTQDVKDVWDIKSFPSKLEKFQGVGLNLTTRNSLINLVESKSLRNVIVWGAKGSGKTALINVFVRDFYEEYKNLFTSYSKVDNNGGRESPTSVSFLDGLGMNSSIDNMSNLAFGENNNGRSSPSLDGGPSLLTQGTSKTLSNQPPYKFNECVFVTDGDKMAAKIGEFTKGLEAWKKKLDSKAERLGGEKAPFMVVLVDNLDHVPPKFQQNVRMVMELYCMRREVSKKFSKLVAMT